MAANFATSSFEDILDDLSSRFIINVPEEELASIERICFQIEQAHWFYEDFIREQNPVLPTFNLRTFTSRFFRHCPLLQKWENEHEKAFETFIKYKVRVPVCGAIILNKDLDKCVLVKGWSAKSGWGFPKGKINKDESQFNCAAREVLEETGFDIRPYINETDNIQVTMREQCVRLYIAPNVPEDTQFQCQTRKEISAIGWHRLADLPGYSKTYNANHPAAKNAGRYYMIVPFMSKLRRWVRNRQRAMRGLPAEPVLSDAEFGTVREDPGGADAMSAAASSTALKSLLGLQNGTLQSDLPSGNVPNDSGSLVLKEIIGVRTEIPHQSNVGLLKEMLGIGNSQSSLDNIHGAMLTTTTTMASAVLKAIIGAQNHQSRPNGSVEFGTAMNQPQLPQPILESSAMLNVVVQRTACNVGSGLPPVQALPSAEKLKQIIGISTPQGAAGVPPGKSAAAQGLNQLLEISRLVEVSGNPEITSTTEHPPGIGPSPTNPLLRFKFDIVPVLDALG